MIIIDTNILIDMYNGRFPKNLKPEGQPCTTSINYAEFLYGIKHEDVEQVKRHFMRNWKILPLDSESSETFAVIKSKTSKSGKRIPDGDIYIASIVIRNNLRLITRDKHFKHINDLDATIL